MPNSDALTGWTITPADDGFHDDFEGSDRPWWTETFWTSFNIPERKIGGWFYNQVLKNQGAYGECNGGAWVWDASDAPALYERNARGLALPPGPRDLNDIALPNGNVIRTLEPLMKYRVRYSDPGALEADLTVTGVMQPNPHPAGCAPFWRGRHFDQAMHVEGEIVLHGERLAVECFSVRDRSWSVRPPRVASEANRTDGGKRAAERPAAPPTTPIAGDSYRPVRSPFNLGYVFGTASPKDAFLAYTLLVEGEEAHGDFVNTGYLVRNGVWAHLVRGQRRCWVDADKGWIFRIEVDAVDTLGRELRAVGDQVSNHGTAEGLFHWKWNGAEGWGENQGGIAKSYPRVKRS